MVSARIARFAFERAGKKSKRPFRIVFSDGAEYRNRPEHEPLFTIIFKYPRAEWRVFLFRPVGIAEGYIMGDLDIEGDIRELVHFGDDVEGAHRNTLNRIRNWWHELRFNNHRIEQAKRNAIAHYGLGTEMFRKYLDPTMTYTCAYWKEGIKTLEEAQRAKLEHVCKKLRLNGGEKLIDIGSGWGSLLFHAYEHYGAMGTNYSPTSDQNRAMEEEIRRRGLEEKIVVKERDFREVEEEDVGAFDKYVSLGVYEHAGLFQLEDWIRAMQKVLKPGGIGVLHFIGVIKRDIESTGIFIRKNVFPGGYLPGISETLELMDKYRLEVLDIENLRRHYAPTLLAWAQNFDSNWKAIQALDPKKFDERFRRRWRFYLYGCSAIFLSERNSVGLFQITFSKGKTKDYPMTRDFLYLPKTGN